MASYSSTTRITGLNSGLDTDSLVEQLMQSESAKYNNLQRKSQKVTWQQEAYRSVISKLQTFQDKWFGTSQTSTNFRYSTAFQNFKNSVKNSDGSDSSAITVNSSKSSASYKINVKQLAQNDVYMSSDTSSEKVISSSKSLDDIAGTITESTPLKFSLTLDGVSKNIEVTADDLAGSNLKDVLNDKLKTAFGKDSDGNAKVSVTDSDKLSFKINVDGGKGHTLKINEGSTREAGSVTSNIFKIDDLKAGLTGDDKKTYSLTVNVNGVDKKIDVTVDKDTTESTLVSSINSALSDAGVDGLSASLVTEKVKDSEGKETDEKTYQIKFTSNSYANDITVNSGDLVTFDADNTKQLTHIGSLNDMGFKNNQSTALNSTGKTAGDILSFGGSDTYEMTINGKTVSIKSTDSISEMMTKIGDGTGVKMTYNSVTNAFKLEAEEMGGSNAISFDDANAQSFFSALGFKNTQKAQDAIIEIDGVETTRASNNIDIDGLDVTLNAVTSEAVTVGSVYDTSAMVDKIKTFVEEYNTLIADLNTQVKQTKAKSGSKGDYSYYEPLLDEEKAEMSEDEIEKWEEKAKEGLLYNDTSITSLLSKMRSCLYNDITTSDGTKISLYSIGVTTSSDYSKNGQLVIDEDKLKKSIEEMGDEIQELFTQTDTGIGDSMKKIIDGAVGSNGTLRTKAGIVGTASVNENTLSKQLNEISEQISKEKTRLANKETYYYNLFANMESAISNSNSQLDSLYSMLS